MLPGHLNGLYYTEMSRVTTACLFKNSQAQYFIIAYPAVIAWSSRLINTTLGGSTDCHTMNTLWQTDLKSIHASNIVVTWDTAVVALKGTFLTRY